MPHAVFLRKARIVALVHVHVVDSHNLAVTIPYSPHTRLYRIVTHGLPAPRIKYALQNRRVVVVRARRRQNILAAHVKKPSAYVVHCQAVVPTAQLVVHPVGQHSDSLHQPSPVVVKAPVAQGMGRLVAVHVDCNTIHLAARVNLYSIVLVLASTCVALHHSFPCVLHSALDKYVGAFGSRRAWLCPAAKGIAAVAVGPGPAGGSAAAAAAAAAAAVASAANPAAAGAGPRECAGCGKRITERYLLKALDMFWHEDCLKCGCCDCRLGEVGSTLYTKANLILCKRDYLRLFGTTGYCAACNKVIPAFEMVMRAKSNVYHLECFACQQCNHRFCVGDRFYLCDNKILCEYDYEERLVFANMVYNPSSLAHIRRQVSNLQPAGDNLNMSYENQHSPQPPPPPPPLQPVQPTPPPPPHPSAAAAVVAATAGPVAIAPPPPNHPPLYSEKTTLAPPSTNQHLRDDGSSGYGSPDSETFDAPCN